MVNRMYGYIHILLRSDFDRFGVHCKGASVGQTRIHIKRCSFTFDTMISLCSFV